MSFENQKTIEAYQKKAKQYIINNSKINPLDLKKSNNRIQNFIKKSISFLPKGSNILEIGSADGELSLFLKKLGYSVTASDVADAFLNEIKKKGLNPIKFNVLTDEFIEKYYCVICWRVFVHFTEDDILNALNRIYDALEPNGVLIFNLISGKNIKEAWIDFPGDYSMGIDRYFRYYSKEELDNIITNTNFKTIEFHEEIGMDKEKWLVYILKKVDN